MDRDLAMEGSHIAVILKSLMLLGLLSAPVYCCTGTAYGPYIFCGGAFDEVGTSTFVVTTYSPTAGSSVFFLTDWFDLDRKIDETVVSIKDQKNNSLDCFTSSANSPYVLVAGDGDSEGTYFYWCPSIPSGVTSITANYSSQIADAEGVVAEFDPTEFATTNVWDTDFRSVSSTPVMVGSITVTNGHTDDLMIAWLHCGQMSGPPPGGWPTVTPNAGWSRLTTSPVIPVQDSLQVMSVTSASNETAAITWPTNNLQWFAMISGLQSTCVGRLCATIHGSMATRGKLVISSP